MRRAKRGASRPLATPAEAEAWTAQTIGGFPRGSLPRVNTSPSHDQRGPVRYWLRCNGVPGEVVKTLPAETLCKAWNDTTNKTLAQLRDPAALATAQAAGADDDDEDGPTVPDPVSPAVPVPGAPVVQFSLVPPRPGLPTPANVTTGTAPAAPAVSPPADVMTAAAAFAAALAAQTPPLDANAVRAIVAEEMERHAHTPRPVSITVQDLPAVTIDTPHPALERVVSALAVGVNVLLVGPAGCGKTTLAEQAAQALSLSLEMTGAVDSPYSLRGFTDASGKPTETAFLRAFRDGALFLFDEMDGSDPGALLAFNAALANGHADFPCGLVAKHDRFRVIAAANTYGSGASREYVGRSQLDAASLDRFAVMALDYDMNFERRLMGLPPLASLTPPSFPPGPRMDAAAWTEHVHGIRAATRKLSIRHVISTRAILTGAKLLAAGWTTRETEEAVLWRGLDAAQVQRIREATAPAMRAAVGA
jgi:cobaltochelatase CobS